MRRFLIAANWKMHGDPARLQCFLESLLERVDAEGPEVVVCPPFPLLPLATMLAGASPLGVGAQNCHWAEEGAFTGEVSATLLAEMGVAWVVIAHSERRQIFGETDETAADRAHAAQQAGLKVMFCVGETLNERESDATFAVLDRQTAALAGLDPAALTVAYEPVWAIGTGRNATPDQAVEAHAFIRGRLAGLFGYNAAAATRILYGGSVKPANAASLLTSDEVDGALVGGASLDADAFWAIIQAAAVARRGA